MGSYSSLYIKKEVLETLIKTVSAKGEKGVELTVSISDESKEFKRPDGTATYQNAAAWVSQTQEQRQAKKDRFYVGNGKCFWTDGKITIAEKVEKAEPVEGYQADLKTNPDDLPF